jgi:hypothetical protein
MHFFYKRDKNKLHVECQNVLGQYPAPVCNWVFVILFLVSCFYVFCSLTSYYQNYKQITFLVMAALVTLSWPKCLGTPLQCLCVSVPTLSTLKVCFLSDICLNDKSYNIFGYVPCTTCGLSIIFAY